MAAGLTGLVAGVDIVMSHCPPRGLGDTSLRGQQCGSSALLAAVTAARPVLHVFGHIHETVQPLS